MRRPGRWGVVAAVLVSALVLAACDGGDEAPERAEQEVAEEQETELTEEPEPVEEAPPRFEVPGAEAMVLTTPGTVSGAWPMLAWEPVDGAASYEVTLYADSGQAYWSWSGEATEIRVGGFPEEPAEDSTIGPRVHEPMTWDVIARDADGAIIAQSGERPIAPSP